MPAKSSIYSIWFWWVGERGDCCWRLYLTLYGDFILSGPVFQTQFKPSSGLSTFYGESSLNKLFSPGLGFILYLSLNPALIEKHPTLYISDIETTVTLQSYSLMEPPSWVVIYLPLTFHIASHIHQPTSNTNPVTKQELVASSLNVSRLPPKSAPLFVRAAFGVRRSTSPAF